jgi:hypothetical protein
MSTCNAALKRRAWWGSLLLATALCGACPAEASPVYPPLLANEVKKLRGKTITPPPCTLCHASPTGGTGTVVTFFGTSMQGLGLRGNAPASLGAALEAADADAQDSDGDGIPDLDELAQGSDPNDGPGRADNRPVPEHGCAIGGSSPRSVAVFAAYLSALLLLRRRRRLAASFAWGAAPGSARYRP